MTSEERIGASMTSEEEKGASTTSNQRVSSRFVGKVALVAGGGSGIGAAVVRQLAAEGCAQVHVADLNGDNAVRVAEEAGGRSHAVDVTDAAAVDRLVADVTGQGGSLDVVVHAAGLGDPQVREWLSEAVESGQPPDVVGRLTDDQWRRIIAVNLDGTFHVLRAAVRAMRRQGWGSIVTVGSSSAFDTLIGYPHYAAAKAGVHAMSQSVAKEAIAYGVRVNTVAPGPVDTPMTAATPSAIRKAMEATVSGSMRYATPEELADSICYLASAGASNVVGAVLLSNGGRFTIS